MSGWPITRTVTQEIWFVLEEKWALPVPNPYHKMSNLTGVFIYQCLMSLSSFNAVILLHKKKFCFMKQTSLDS